VYCYNHYDDAVKGFWALCHLSYVGWLVVICCFGGFVSGYLLFACCYACCHGNAVKRFGHYGIVCTTVFTTFDFPVILDGECTSPVGYKL
jgi:hypothetical protein